MKKLLLFAIMLLVQLAASAQTKMLLGDMNSDGELTVADLTTTASMILGNQPLQYVEVGSMQTMLLGDMNNDGYLTVSDLTTTASMILGNQPWRYIEISNGEPQYVEPQYVDLGLPSGTLWATFNVGASKPEEYGDYFAWGETEPKSTYTWPSYKWCNDSRYTMTKYCTSSTYGTVDNKTKLEPADDAATANWGPDWCMPTPDQIQELCNSDYTTTTWTDQNGVNGYLITSKSNGNSLFLPATGSRLSDSFGRDGAEGYYWSSELYSVESIIVTIYGGDMYFNSYLIDYESSDYRSTGHCVRAVRK